MNTSSAAPFEDARQRRSKVLVGFIVMLFLPLMGGCQLLVDDADREVYPLVRQRQSEALGISSDMYAGEPDVPGLAPEEAYDFVPSPLDPQVPEEFSVGTSVEDLARAAEEAVAAGEEGGVQDSEPDVEPKPGPETETAPPGGEGPGPDPGPEDPEGGSERGSDGRSAEGDGFGAVSSTAPEALPFTVEALTEMSLPERMAVLGITEGLLDFGVAMTLSEALTYAVRFAREYQDAREDLYLEALDLTLERHLWTPLFVSTLSSTYTEFPDEEFRAVPDSPDRALQAVADFSVTQALPYGGEVVAQWVGQMVRDLENHVTTAESGSIILSANIPLLRGAGRVAYESRYQAERDLIYEARAFERFRRTFLTRVAASYFDLVARRTNLINGVANVGSQRDNYMQTRAWVRAERTRRVEENRAQVSYLQTRNGVIADLQAYQTALDRFKILLGMPVETRIDVVDEAVDLFLPDVELAGAARTALVMRLDLITVRDQVEDAIRGVEIAKNRVLPDLNVSGSVRWDTNPDHLSMFDYLEGNETWNVGLDMEIPLDRKRERNLLRAALVARRRAERRLDLSQDNVRLDVRDALRTIRRTQESLKIQASNVRTSEIQKEIAKLEFQQGKSDNRNVVDAENDLLRAQNLYSQELSNLRQAILNLRLQTGTLRVTEDGHWAES